MCQQGYEAGAPSRLTSPHLDCHPPSFVACFLGYQEHRVKAHAPILTAARAKVDATRTENTPTAEAKELLFHQIVLFFFFPGDELKNLDQVSTSPKQVSNSQRT